MFEENFEFLRNFKPDNSKQTTSLVSIISPKCQISDLQFFVKQEQNTAQNIRNNTNRKSVLDALTKISSTLSNMKTIPDEGIAIFSAWCI